MSGMQQWIYPIRLSCKMPPFNKPHGWHWNQQLKQTQNKFQHWLTMIYAIPWRHWRSWALDRFSNSIRHSQMMTLFAQLKQPSNNHKKIQKRWSQILYCDDAATRKRDGHRWLNDASRLSHTDVSDLSQIMTTCSQMRRATPIQCATTLNMKREYNEKLKSEFRDLTPVSAKMVRRS